VGGKGLRMGLGFRRGGSVGEGFGETEGVVRGEVHHPHRPSPAKAGVQPEMGPRLLVGGRDLRMGPGFRRGGAGGGIWGD